MFKLHRHRSDRLGDKLEFRFSNLQAFKIPRGWDKLVLSIISVESGKIVAKSAKATVRSGTCQWTDTESIWVSQEEASDELEESQFKIVISMGSSRSGILGEVILNLADYLNSEDSGPLLLPLDYCEPGSALQVKIQCFAARSKFRVGKSLKERTSHVEDINSNHDDIDKKSDGSNRLFNKNTGSSSSNQFGSTLSNEHGNKDTTRSTSGSHRSFDSGDGSFGKSNNGGASVGRQDSAGSHVSANSSAGPGEELSKSNPSSFNSRASGSSFNTNQWQEVSPRASHGLAPLEIGPSDSSKALLEAAEELEELHDEVKMWERHARQLKVDIETLKKELSEKSNHLTNRDIELSAAYNERDSLKQEVQRLQLAMKESRAQKTHADTSRDENSINMLKELEDEVKFQKESNANLVLQLKKSQESNLELVAILQELEETIEKTKHQMDLEMELSTAYDERDSLKQEVERLQLALEELMKKKTYTDARSENSVHTLKELEDDIHIQKETNANLMLQLKKSQESNIELVSILQELEDTVEKSKGLMDLDIELSAAYSERDSLKQEVERLQLALEESMTKQTHLGTSRGEHSENMLKQLEAEVNFQKESNANLMLQLKKSQESNVELVAILQELEDTVEKQALEIANFTEKNNELKDEGKMDNKKLFHNEEEWERKLAIKEQEIANLQETLSSMLSSQATSDLVRSGSHSDLIKEIEALRAKIQELERDCLELTDENLDLIYKLKELSGNKVSHDSPSYEVGSNILHHNFAPDAALHQSKTDEPEDVLEREKVVTVPSLAKPRNLEILFHDLELDLQHHRDEANDLQVKLQKAQLELEEKNMEVFELNQKIGSIQDSEIQSYIEELDRSKAAFDEIKSQLLLKQQEVNSLTSLKKDQEENILNLQKEKSQLEDNLSVLHRESGDTSKYLEDVQRDLMIVTSSLDSQISSNKVLEEKSMDLESHIKELNLHINELEQEKLQLSGGIAALEAELKNSEADKESIRLELEDSKSIILNMKIEIEKYKDEIEMQKTHLEQKLHEAQKQMSEFQEESDTLRQSNSKLQVTIESLDEECDSLQRLTGDLKRQKLEMHEHVTHLEVELEHAQSKSLGYFKKVELLEEEFSSLQKKTSSKEKSLLLQIDQMIEEHKEHEETINQAHALLEKMESEKRVEVENLEREIAQLMAQMSSTQDEREKTASDAILEASILRSDKAKLEVSLNEFAAKVKSYETELQSLRQESKVKIDGLVELLNDSKHSEEMLMADIQDMQRLANDAKSSEENSRNLANELEIKLKTSDYEKQQISEEMSILKIQVENISELRDEILVLKASLDEQMIEKEKLGGLLRSSSEECEQLKRERESLIEKLTSLQDELNTEKDDTQSRIALQEKLLKLENDLSSKEASSVYDEEIMNELNKIKSANRDYQRKIQSLEDEKEELTKKANLIEEELMLKKATNDYDQDEKVNAKPHDEEEESHVSEVGESKIVILEQKLAEALASNNVYKEQLDKFLIEKQTDNPEVCKKTPENETSTDNTGKVSSLEAELKEMKERYLHMSLQYAEVEAQREELVLQLKSVNKGKRWFS